ncbi:MAG: glycoside hydrolase family 88 protein [Clostridiales bacterium]|nr:glycoside hydrolase family 88 protein [Clostridiales bacterium]
MIKIDNWTSKPDCARLLELLDICALDLLERSTAKSPAWNIEHARSGAESKWNYMDGLMISAYLSLWRWTGKPLFAEFSERFVSEFVTPGGEIATYVPGEKNLDNISPGRNLAALYELTGERKYLRAAERLRAQLDQQPRLKCGSFWHKLIYPCQVWLDGLYMAQPFYMAHDAARGCEKGCRDSFAQFENARLLMKDSDGLYRHGFDESRLMGWADPVTGLSSCVWLRAVGWLLAGLADTLEASPEEFSKERKSLSQMLQELVDAMLPWQTPEGMFLQVINKPGIRGNYPETSGTALYAYAVLKSARLKFLPKRYAASAEKALIGTLERYLKGSELGGICLVAGLGGPKRRDGSESYYLSEPVVSGEAKGVGAAMLARSELMAYALSTGAV